MRIISAVAIAMVVSGCASTATRSAAENTAHVGQAYGQVVDVYEADNGKIRSICTSIKDDQASQAICSHLKDFEIAKAVVLRVNRFITSQVPVPKNLGVQKGSFLEFSPAKNMASFVRIAAPTATSSCKWEGPTTYDFENSATGAVAGFAAGMLIVPAVVGLGSDDALSGGVICDGWTYKSLLATK